MRTGGGKSLCMFLLPPAMSLNAIGIIVSPLVSLMDQQVSHTVCQRCMYSLEATPDELDCLSLLPGGIFICTSSPAVTLGPPKEPPTKQRNLKPLPIPPYMLMKTAEEVFKKNSRYVNKDEIGRVAAKLARRTFFGESVLVQSSISGTENTRPLDPSVLQRLKDTIRQKFIW